MKTNQKKMSGESKSVQSIDDKSAICIRLDLGKIINGLHLDLMVDKEKSESFAALVINEEPIGIFGMEWDDSFLPGNGRVFPRNGMHCMHAILLGEIEE